MDCDPHRSVQIPKIHEDPSLDCVFSNWRKYKALKLCKVIYSQIDKGTNSD